jgi:hypothetical protein
MGGRALAAWVAGQSAATAGDGHLTDVPALAEDSTTTARGLLRVAAQPPSAR